MHQQGISLVGIKQVLERAKEQTSRLCHVTPNGVSPQRGRLHPGVNGAAVGSCCRGDTSSVVCVVFQ